MHNLTLSTSCLLHAWILHPGGFCSMVVSKWSEVDWTLSLHHLSCLCWKRMWCFAFLLSSGTSYDPHDLSKLISQEQPHSDIGHLPHYSGMYPSPLSLTVSDWLKCSQILPLPKIMLHFPKCCFQAQGPGSLQQTLPVKKIKYLEYLWVSCLFPCCLSLGSHTWGKTWLHAFLRFLVGSLLVSFHIPCQFPLLLRFDS